jgi:hypothetical protein
MAERTGKITIYTPDVPLPSADLGNVTGTATGFLDSTGAKSINLPLPSVRQLTNKLMRLKAWGRVVGGTTANFTPTLYYTVLPLVSDVVSNNTIIKAATAAAVDSANHSWHLEAVLRWDSTSSKIQGTTTWSIAGVAVTALSVNAVISSADSTANAPQYLCIAGLFSASNSGNKAFLDGFQIEVTE